MLGCERRWAGDSAFDTFVGAADIFGLAAHVRAPDGWKDHLLGLEHLGSDKRACRAGADPSKYCFHIDTAESGDCRWQLPASGDWRPIRQLRDIQLTDDEHVQCERKSRFVQCVGNMHDRCRSSWR